MTTIAYDALLELDDRRAWITAERRILKERDMNIAWRFAFTDFTSIMYISFQRTLFYFSTNGSKIIE
jgi:hypothetical protein